MGFNNLNPSDTLEAAVKRGDEYFVVLAESDDVAFVGAITFLSPVAGFAIGQNSDFDQCGVQFSFPASLDAQTQTRVVSVGAPLIARLPPTGVQASPTITLITGDAGGNINQLRPTDRATLDGPGFAMLELYVYLRAPAASPPMRRRDTITSAGSATVNGVEVIAAQAYAFGRKEFMVQTSAVGFGGALRVIQKCLVTAQISELSLMTIAAGEVVLIHGFLHGADIISVLFTASGGAGTVGARIEVRD